MRFQEIVGQDVAISQLQRAYAHQRLSHAYISVLTARAAWEK